MKSWYWLSLSLSLLACGGKSQVNDGAGASGAAAGAGGSQAGAGGSAGLAGASGAGGATCPALQPLPGSACTGQDCCNYSFDSCNSSQLCCNGGVWVPSGLNFGQSYDCSSFAADNLPVDGSSCACMGTLDCVYGGCALGGLTRLTCDGSTWSVSHSVCPEKKYCDPAFTVPCAWDGVCTTTETLAGPVYACHVDPCLEQNKATSCDCASSLCAPYMACSMQGGGLYCSCPTC